MTNRFAPAICLAVLAASAALARRAPAVEPIDTTICELVEHSLQFNGKLVRIHAEAYGAGIDTPEEFVDDRCEEYSLRIEFPGRLGGYQVRNFQKAIGPLHGNHRIYSGREASGTFVGVFYYAWLPKGGIDIHLTVEAVPDLVVPPLPPPPPAAGKTGQITGRIMDLFLGPTEAAVVSLIEAGSKSVVLAGHPGPRGWITFGNITPGEYEIHVTLPAVPAPSEQVRWVKAKARRTANFGTVFVDILSNGGADPLFGPPPFKP